MDEKFVVPGDLLGPCEGYNIGEGICKRGSNMYVSLPGRVKIEDHNVFLLPLKSPVKAPEKGDVALCRVVSVSKEYAKVMILSINNVVLMEPLRGIIRRESIRATEKDTVVVVNSFRPRDVVRARVISLGESQDYGLSTAESELGVVFATSAHGGRMIPYSWSEMQCIETKINEKRKVAKVVDAIPL